MRAQKMTGATAIRWKLLPVSIPDVQDWVEGSSVFEALAIHREQRFNIDSADEPVQVHGLSAEASLFGVLGVQPALGALTLSDVDSGGDPYVAALGHARRQRNFRRGRVVPEEAIRKMAAKLQPPRPEEGFVKIIVVRPASP